MSFTRNWAPPVPGPGHPMTCASWYNMPCNCRANALPAPPKPYCGPAPEIVIGDERIEDGVIVRGPRS